MVCQANGWDTNGCIGDSPHHLTASSAGVALFHVLALINLALLVGGFGTVLLKRPRKRWLRNHYYFMGWSYVGLWAATMTEITVRLVGWSLAVAVAVPTIAVTVLGGAWVQLRQRQTLAQVKSGRSAA